MTGDPSVPLWGRLIQVYPVIRSSFSSAHSLSLRCLRRESRFLPDPTPDLCSLLVSSVMKGLPLSTIRALCVLTCLLLPVLTSPNYAVIIKYPSIYCLLDQVSVRQQPG